MTSGSASFRSQSAQIEYLSSTLDWSGRCSAYGLPFMGSLAPDGLAMSVSTEGIRRNPETLSVQGLLTVLCGFLSSSACRSHLIFFREQI
jgi:hypothetical protein